MADELVLEMRGIRKEFPGTVANDNVDLEVRRGEVHALLGENGAGKSTLMNILYGLYRPDAGEIRLNGKQVEFGSARDAIGAGIGMVHQHFMLIPVMTVAENIVLGVEPRDGSCSTSGRPRSGSASSRERFSLAVDPAALVSDITVGQEQRVEILKALYRGADILILDEPTAVLTPQEAEELFEIIRSLQADGKSIIFISHKLNEVLEIADRITVLRRGKKIETVPREGATEASLARAMVGREVLLRVEKAPAQPGDVLLSVEDLHVRDERGIEKVRGVSFEVRAGEIVGIAGVDGNGQTELIEAITGLMKSESGMIKRRRGATCTMRPRARCSTSASATSPRTASGAGSCSSSRSPRTSRCTTTRRRRREVGLAVPEPARRARRQADPRVRRARRRAARSRAGGLSGGNQQKVVVAREIARDPKVLIAAQPTRGLDVGAIEYLHRRIVTSATRVAPCCSISLELEEILSLSDRILVIYEGEIVGEHTGDVSEQEIGLEMLGGQERPRHDDRRPEPAAGARRSRRRAARSPAASRSSSAPAALIVPMLTALLAFIIGGARRRSRPATTRCSPTATSSTAPGLNWIFHPTTDIATTDAYNLSQTLLQTTTLILCGLAVAFAFRCGMFNIGGQGQYLVGLYVANWLGYSLAGMSPLPHILIAVGGATLAGAAWAGIAGFLKATVGAHEVISTIMLNWIAIWVGIWLFGDGGPLQNAANKAVPISNDVAASAQLPVFWGVQGLQGLDVAFFVAIAALIVFALILNRTTLGYEVRAVGFNPEAAAYGGISVKKNLIRAMAISGAFAGLAGALDMLGYLYHFGTSDIPASSVGFLGIAVALLGRNTAVGVGFGALLFGALLFGTTHGLSSNVIDP